MGWGDTTQISTTHLDAGTDDPAQARSSIKNALDETTKILSGWSKYSGLIYVISTLSATPGAPASGDIHLVGSTATGAFATHEGELALWDGAAWDFEAPTEGLSAYFAEQLERYTFFSAVSAKDVWLSDAVRVVGLGRKAAGTATTDLLVAGNVGGGLENGFPIAEDMTIVSLAVNNSDSASTGGFDLYDRTASVIMTVSIAAAKYGIKRAKADWVHIDAGDALIGKTGTMTVGSYDSPVLIAELKRRFDNPT